MLGEERRAHHEGALTEPASSRLVSPDIRDEFGLETIDMNMGPQHPAMHGLLRLILELDGEAVIPLTDRLDYFANMHNEHGYVLAVEDLLDVEIPPRAEYIRVLMCELMRLASHIPSIGFLMLELGAFTPILYAFRERERIQSIFEAVTGARMMFHYIRIGGVKADLPEGMPEQMWEYIEGLEQRLQPAFVDMIEGNEIFIARTRGIGKITQEKAVEMGLTGPPLRCTGVDFDIRRDYPYSWYPNVKFDVVTDTEGDAEAAYRVRIGEIRQSIGIVKQVLEKLPEGAVMGDVPRRIRP